MTNPTSRPTSRPEGQTEGEEEARRLAEALGISPPPGSVAPEPLRPDPTSGEGPIRVDKCGALEGQPKLAPVRAYPQGGGFLPGGRQEASSEPAKPAAGKGPKPKKATLPPKIGEVSLQLGAPKETNGAANGNGDSKAHSSSSEAERLRDADMVRIPTGAFLFGEDKRRVEVPEFSIDTLPVTHGEYEKFVRATGHRPPLYWAGGAPPDDLRDHPVVGVDYFDALAYARWRGKDLPYEDEWERAARGTDGRSYPWGDEPDWSAANTARTALKMTVPVGFFPTNVSPEGVRDLVGNTWELTHSPAPGGGVVVRGGSWYDFALYAKSHFRFASRTDARNGTIGFRCVRRSAERRDALREVSLDVAEAEIAARRGPEPAVDATRFSPERRDLVPDLRRLRNLLADRAAEEVRAGIETERAPKAPATVAKAPVVPAPPPMPSVAPATVSPPVVPPPAATVPPPPTPPRPPQPQPPAPRPPTPQPRPQPPAPQPIPVEPPPVAPPSPFREPATGAAVAAAASAVPPPPPPPIHVPSTPKATPRPPATTPPSAVGIDRSGFQKAAEVAVAQRRVAATTSTPSAANGKGMPKAVWLAYGAAVVACLALLVTLIGHLVGGSNEPESDDVGPVVVRGAGDPDATTGEPGEVDPSEAPPGETPPSESHPGESHPEAPPSETPPSEPPPGESHPGETPPSETTPPVEAPPETPSPWSTVPSAPSIEGLPDLVPHPGDKGPPVLSDGARKGWQSPLARGVWLLVFSPTSDPEDATTVRAVDELHRRLRPTGVEVLLVTPRNGYLDASGKLLPPEAIVARLKERGATSDMTTLLDPPAAGKYGTAVRTSLMARHELVAILMAEGKEQARTMSPEGVFTLQSLKDIAKKAVDLGPASR